MRDDDPGYRQSLDEVCEALFCRLVEIGRALVEEQDLRLAV
jgi:hypothetical protein